VFNGLLRHRGAGAQRQNRSTTCEAHARLGQTIMHRIVPLDGCSTGSMPAAGVVTDDFANRRVKLANAVLNTSERHIIATPRNAANIVCRKINELHVNK
jgi:hypothetical protein